MSLAERCLWCAELFEQIKRCELCGEPVCEECREDHLQHHREQEKTW